VYKCSLQQRERSYTAIVESGFDCTSVCKCIGFVCIFFNNICANCNERFCFLFFVFVFSFVVWWDFFEFYGGLVCFILSCHPLLLLGIFYSIFCTGDIYIYIYNLYSSRLIIIIKNK
jgi:apolipoprotein N-acyltransferase